MWLDYDKPIVHNVKTVELLGMLNRRGILSVKAFKFLACALASGGYIAGGFATMLYRSAFYVELGYTLSPFQSIEIYLKSRNGDIDIFFPNEELLRSFQSSMKNGDYMNQVLKNCVLYTIDRVKIQVITCRTTPAMVMFKSFDISNACVAFFEKQAVHPTGLQDLMLSRKLHVQMWTRLTVLRMMKWFRKQSPFLSIVDRECNNDFLAAYREHKTSTADVEMDDQYEIIVDSIA